MYQQMYWNIVHSKATNRYPTLIRMSCHGITLNTLTSNIESCQSIYSVGVPTFNKKIAGFGWLIDTYFERYFARISKM